MVYLVDTFQVAKIPKETRLHGLSHSALPGAMHVQNALVPTSQHPERLSDVLGFEGIL
jgi:hypothetical protein